MTSNTKTTIQIDNATKKDLCKIGKKGETYDNIIRRLIKSHEYITFMDEQYNILDNEKDWVSLDEMK